ncbi:hypothetical protein SPHINGOT1_70217 [Sphingomonas sp. T1]|nr:hypothetical protein SPHINGOT1_70217 [Sphingomonas sp. T1]
MDEVRFLRDRHEQARADRAVSHGVPAQQRLEPDHFDRFARHDRLEHQAELVVRDRFAEPAFDPPAEANILVHALVEHARHAPAAPFGVVEREVGPPHDVDRVAALPAMRHDQPGRGAALDGTAKDLEADRTGRDHPFAGEQGAGLVRGTEQHAEFVAAKSRDQRTLGRGPAKDRADLTDQRVAGKVPQRVVDQLEPVEIDHHRREPPIRAGAFGKRAEERQPVGRVGQRVVRRQMDRTAFIGRQLGGPDLELRHLPHERCTHRVAVMVELPALRQCQRGLAQLGADERLGDMKDLVDRPGHLGDPGERGTVERGDDHEIDVGVQFTDPARGLADVEPRRRLQIEEGDRERRGLGDCGFDRGDRGDAGPDGGYRKRVSLRVSRRRFRPEYRTGVVVMNSGFVVDNQNTHRTPFLAIPDPARVSGFPGLIARPGG